MGMGMSMNMSMNMGADAGAVSLGASPGTVSAAVGVLGALVGVRWGVGAWERAKRRWWADWKRVGEGLGRDLEVGVGFFFFCVGLPCMCCVLIFFAGSGRCG